MSIPENSIGEDAIKSVGITRPIRAVMLAEVTKNKTVLCFLLSLNEIKSLSTAKFKAFTITGEHKISAHRKIKNPFCSRLNLFVSSVKIIATAEPIAQTMYKDFIGFLSL